MPRAEVSEHWKSILLLNNPRSIGLFKPIGYGYNLKIMYNTGLIHEYKYNLNNDMTINSQSIDLYVNGKYNRSICTLSSNEREEKLLNNFLTFLYTCHNQLDSWKENYDIFTYSTYKLLKKFICNIL